jgi:hypothetical protein
MKSLKATLRFLEEKKNLAANKKKPIIYLCGGFSYAHAPHRQDQTNPFAVDNFNYVDLGAFMGFQWDLNFFRKNLESKRYQLEIESVKEKLHLLRIKVELEILRKFVEIKANINLLTQAESSLRAARSWLRVGMDNWEMGIGEVERLIRAYNAYYQMKGMVIKRKLKLNLSLVNFAFILGNVRSYLDWIKNGTVKIY